MALTYDFQLLSNKKIGNTGYGDLFLRIYGKINSQSIPENYTSVTYEERIFLTNGGYNTSFANCVINGDLSNSASLGYTSFTAGEKTILAASGNIYHNPDGTKTITVNCSYSGYKFSGDTSSVVDLPRIPRASNVAISPFIIGQPAVITIGTASSSFTHTIDYAFGSLSGTIATKTSQTSFPYSFNTDDFYKQIPNSQTGIGTVTCYTFSGETQIGVSSSNFTATATGDPVINSITIVDSNATAKALTGNENVFIKGFSNANINVSANAVNYATLKAVTTTNDSQSINTLVGTINGATSGLFTTKLMDSRDYSNNPQTGTTKKTLVDYVAPNLINTKCNITRTSELSKVANIDLEGYFWNKNFGVVANTLIVKLQARETGTTPWVYTRTIPSSNIIIDTANNKFTVNDFKVGDEASIYFGPDKQYDFEIWTEDKLVGYNYTKIFLPLQKGNPLYEYSEDGVNFNGYLKNNGVLVAKSTETLNITNTRPYNP